MFDVSQLIVHDLQSAGGGLWESVACNRRHDRWIVYANLRAHAATEPELVESARIIQTVLDNRLSGKDWIAAVLCGQRVSYTIRPE